jgi:hypothetical protein
MLKLYDGEVKAELEAAEAGFGGAEVAVGGGVRRSNSSPTTRQSR